MQLRHARLCLNCEEIHAASHCPVCASESFACVGRWIPPNERRQVDRTSSAGAGLSPGRRAPQQNRQRSRWVRRGAAGVALLALSRVVWTLSRPVQWDAIELPHEDDEVGSNANTSAE